MTDYFEYSELSEASLSQSSSSILWRIAKFSAIFFLAGTLFCGLAFGFWLKNIGLFDLDTEKLNKLADFRSPDRTRIYDVHDRLLTSVYRNHHVFLPFEKIPQQLRLAIVAAEDKRFFEHPGVDLWAVGRVMQDFLQSKGRFRQGGSTISQQLVRRVLLSTEKTLERKVKEMVLAVHLERIMAKEKIFEVYANNMFLGAGSYGVGAAALRYFGKSVEELSLKESALIAGLFQLPSVLSPFQNPDGAEQRAGYVLNRMRALSMIGEAEYLAALSEKPNYVRYFHMQREVAPYFVDHVLAEIDGNLAKWDKDDGLRIYTTFEPAIQNMMEQTLTESEVTLQRFDKSIYSSKPNPGQSLHGQVAMIAVRPKNGEIVAMIGGRDYSESQFNRAVQAKRSPGSAFKPFTYAQALISGYKWSDLFFVAPIDVEGYRPREFAGQYLTETTMLKSFYQSLNSPTIELGMKVGVDKIIELAKKMGIESTLKQEAGTLIGSSEVSLLEMARAYGTIANHGIRTETSVIRKIADHRGHMLWERPEPQKTQQRVLDEKIAYLMVEGMRAVLRVGTGQTAAHLADKAVGKTGTGDRSIDNWFCGFTEDLVFIVWVGTDENLPAFGNISGSTVALPIWSNFMNRYIAKSKPANFVAPEGVVEFRINTDFGTASEKGLSAWFLNGQVPAGSSAKALSVLKQKGRHRRAFSR